MEKDIQEGKGKSRIQLVVVFLIGFLLGIFVGPTFLGDYAINDANTDASSVSENNNGNEPQNIEGTTTASRVVVNDQLAGDRVLLETVEFDASGWAVVHEDIEGTPGNALGARRFDPGTHADGHVVLLRDTTPEQLYYVILYTDDGDREFNIKTDTPLTDAEDAFILDTFTTILVDRKTN